MSCHSSPEAILAAMICQALLKNSRRWTKVFWVAKRCSATFLTVGPALAVQASKSWAASLKSGLKKGGGALRARSYQFSHIIFWASVQVLVKVSNWSLQAGELPLGMLSHL